MYVFGSFPFKKETMCKVEPWVSANQNLEPRVSTNQNKFWFATKTSFGLLILVVPPYTSFCMYHLPKSAHEGCPRLSFTSFHIHHSFRVTLSIPRWSSFFILYPKKYISQKPPLSEKKNIFFENIVFFFGYRLTFSPLLYSHFFISTCILFRSRFTSYHKNHFFLIFFFLHLIDFVFFVLPV